MQNLHHVVVFFILQMYNFKVKYRQISIFFSNTNVFFRHFTFIQMCYFVCNTKRHLVSMTMLYFPFAFYYISAVHNIVEDMQQRPILDFLGGNIAYIIVSQLSDEAAQFYWLLFMYVMWQSLIG